jgi:hypothetical protein
MSLRAERANQRFVAIVMAIAAIGLTVCTINVVRGEEFYLASTHSWPGAVWRSEHGLPEREVHLRPAAPLVSAPGSVPRIANIAVTADDKQYYCSGLDGYILHNLRGHDVVTCKFEGQIRDLAIGREDHTIYFSVVATPVNGAPLADGKLYKYDWYTGGPIELATVKQQQVGGNWWGAFAIHDGSFHLATLEDSSKIFRLDGADALPIHSKTGFRITGFTISSEGEYFFATGEAQVFRTFDFQRVHSALATRRRITDVTIPGQGKSE